MIHRLIVRPLAERDLAEAQRWYEQQQAGLGAEFRSAIESSLRAIAVNPRAYPVVYRGLRRKAPRRFPYLIYYSIQGDAVVVVACWHSKREPLVFDTRLP